MKMIQFEFSCYLSFKIFDYINNLNYRAETKKKNGVLSIKTTPTAPPPATIENSGGDGR